MDWVGGVVVDWARIDGRVDAVLSLNTSSAMASATALSQLAAEFQDYLVEPPPPVSVRWPVPAGIFRAPGRTAPRKRRAPGRTAPRKRRAPGRTAPRKRRA